MPRPKIVAVDGPAGSGKSSICSAVCQQLGWSYVNTGALYRAVGMLVVERGLDVGNEEKLSTLLDEFAQGVYWDHDQHRLFIGARDLTPELSSVAVGNAASLVAKLPLVRAKLLPLQRSLSLTARGGAMVDGRDIGTVVFPDADLKIFMTASLEQRALRRRNQILKENPEQAMTTDEFMESIASRDHQDAARGNAPMRQAEDAVLFDTSAFSVDDAVRALLGLLKDRLQVS